jgi:lipoprotein signal peptidase
VSNVADALLIVGIIGLMWHLWRADPRRATQRPASD